MAQVKNYEESSNWNNAKRYSDAKIMMILESLDPYEIRAEHGFSNDDELIKNHKITPEKLGYIKFCAFKFLVSKLIQLINNSEFAIINKKEDADKCLNDLKIINDIYIPELESDVVSNKLMLPDYYPVIFKIVQNVKAVINEPLNKNNLIFMGNKVDYDPKEHKKRILEEAGALEE